MVYNQCININISGLPVTALGPKDFENHSGNVLPKKKKKRFSMNSNDENKQT